METRTLPKNLVFLLAPKLLAPPPLSITMRCHAD